MILWYQCFLMQENLGLWSSRFTWGDLLILQGQEKAGKFAGVWAALYPGFSETWGINKGFDLQPHSPLADVHLTCTWHTSMISLSRVFLLPVLRNFWSWRTLSHCLLALYKSVQWMDPLLRCSQLWPPTPLLQTKSIPLPPCFPFEKGWGPMIAFMIL